MDRGWSGYLTLHGQEKNVNALGEPRIDLNMEDLEALYESLARDAQRRLGQVHRALSPERSLRRRRRRARTWRRSATWILSREGSTQLTGAGSGRGRKVQSPRVVADGGGGGEQSEGTVVGPMFPESLVEMVVYMPLLMDAVCVVTQPAIPGRININQAPRALLMGIPGIEETMVEEIINQRVLEATDDAEAAATQHETWLLTSGIVTLDEMKLLRPFVCAGGDVFRAQIVGYYEDGTAASRAEVIFDATGAVPRIVSLRDISHLGRGYPLELLGVRMTGTW